MLNLTLYKREMKGSFKLLVIFAAIITMYVSIIISMYDPEMTAALNSFVEAFPELMASVGMSDRATNLLDFMISYLYGLILLIFPMLFSILRGNGLIAKYVDKGSMVTLVAAPIKRRTIAFTQMCVLISGVALIMMYVTGLEIIVAHLSFPGELVVENLLKLNVGLMCLHLFIAGICFLSSCVFSDIKYSIAFGAGIPALMYVLQMLANAGEKAEAVKYCTFFTLFDANGIVAGEGFAMIGIAIFLIGSILLFSAGITAFCKKDLHI